MDKTKLKGLKGKPEKNCVFNKKTQSNMRNLKNQKAHEQVDEIVQELESKSLSIVDSNDKWNKVGNAFANEFNESGRDYFIRISMISKTYTELECDDHYNLCLIIPDEKDTISIFFDLAKEACIQINNSDESKVILDSNKYFPKNVYKTIPDFLKRVVEKSTSNGERDMLLIGAMATLSSCLPNIYGIYDGETSFPNLYLFVSANAASGKGKLNYCRRILHPIHYSLLEESRLLRSEYKYGSEKPPSKMLFIPANSSASGFNKLLSDNEGVGLIFETEGDTLSTTFGRDFSDYSDSFRKAFHHEIVSYYRKTDDEHVEIESPKLSTVLSGTPNQITSLIPSAEDGLFSRFLYYNLDSKPEWKNVFAHDAEVGLDSYFDELGAEYFEFYKSLLVKDRQCFMFTETQQNSFNEYFSEIHTSYLSKGVSFLGVVNRLGTIAFRIAMIFSVLRLMEDKNDSKILTCRQDDFDNTLTMISVLINHSEEIFNSLPCSVKSKKHYKNLKESFFDLLLQEFNRDSYLEKANELQIKEKTAEGYIKKLVDEGRINHYAHNLYLKT